MPSANPRFDVDAEFSYGSSRTCRRIALLYAGAFVAVLPIGGMLNPFARGPRQADAPAFLPPVSVGSGSQPTTAPPTAAVAAVKPTGFAPSPSPAISGYE